MAASTTAGGARSGYIAGPIQDAIFLIAAPSVAIAVYLPFGLVPAFGHAYAGERFGLSLSDGFITAVIYGHLFIVFFRSHLNHGIFVEDRFRFVAVPIVLLALTQESLGTLLYRQGDVDAAVVALVRAVELAPGAPTPTPSSASH